MSDKSERARAAVTLAFFEAFTRDHERQEVRSLEEYQKLWPGFEGVIAEEFRAALRDLQADAQADAEIDSAAPGRIAH